MTMTRTAVLTDVQRDQFFAEGFVCVPNMFTASDLEPLRQEIAALVDDTARHLFIDGRITRLHEEESFETRLTRLLADHPETQSEFCGLSRERPGVDIQVRPCST